MRHLPLLPIKTCTNMVEILCFVGVSIMSHEAASQSLFSRFVLTPARFLIKRRRDRRQFAEMMTMSDALLRDIGLTRFDLVTAIHSKGGLTSTGSLSRVAAARSAAVHVIETARVPVSVSEPYLKAA
ncbi:DUF1127 domain-containing protein [Rhizobium sp. MHM7A]|uniref:DUF1127 domain-containing protein n=1 Tax=Rhizobium sp. MHM7A TaxID=2583233 RepID=UPI0011066052|nr:DUF1127 domain-containing protein [Rhizobium sp. MHM7A]TLX16333.1 DUF1127 domain-containing protein [Rhizobium sp. MHM7A]